MKAKTLLNIKFFSAFLTPLLQKKYNLQKFSKLLKVTIIITFLIQGGLVSAQTLIPLTTDMITNESGVGNATQIVDEQAIAGDPANNAGGQPFSTWYTGFNPNTYPASTYIDLGALYDLTDIYVFDLNSSGNLIIEYGSPGSWLPLASFNLNKYLKWRGQSVNAQTQYVRITRESAGAIFSEIVIYGSIPLPPAPIPQKLVLEPSMMTNEMAIGNPGLLVDEQAIAGDPTNNAGGNPTTTWFTNWNPSSHPANAYIDLGELHQISQVYLRDYNNSGNFEVEYGSPGNWTLLLTDDLKKFGKWKEHNVDVQTQYLRFRRTTAGANVSEVVLYGYPVENDIDAIPPAAVSNLIISDITENTIALQWTAPGNDGNTGTASTYDLRYSPNPIDNNNFDAAIPITTSPPSIAGTTETAMLDNLPPNTTYYFALKSSDETGNTSPLSNILAATTDESTFIPLPSFKIPINPSMVINESGLGDAGKLADEQETSGDPINNAGGTPNNLWFTGWNPADYPAHAYVDLGKEYVLTSIFLFDTYNAGNVTISYGSPSNWIPLFTDPMPTYQTWNQHDTQIKTQYLRVSRSSGGSNVAEIVLYGYEENPEVTAPDAIADLSTSLPTPYSLQLKWTVPNNAGESAPTSYELRYSTAPINEANFEAATAANNLPTPANGGETETFTLNNLLSNTLYYFAIKSANEDNLISEISNIATGTTLDVLTNNQFIIPVDINEVVNESGYGNAQLLFDEAELAGDPANNNSGGANTLWYPGAEPFHHPASAYIDLKQTFLIDAIYLFDITGTDDFIIEYGTPGNWQELTTVVLDKLFTWKNIQTHVETRYLRFTRAGVNSNTREIVLYGSAAGLDPGPPANIVDLSVIPSSTFATLQWTAPGDDENTGTAAEYDIRYSTTPITSENFEDATPTEAPTPAMAGSSESVVVYNLMQSTTYYFAMKTTDEMTYTSSISNVVSTLTTTDTDETPPAAIIDLTATNITATSATLQWTSVGDDNHTGTARIYDIRMSLENITPNTFFRAITIEGEPIPIENGLIQSMTVNQLPPNTTICFAMKTWDEVPNISDISNVICIDTEDLETESKIPLFPSMITNETKYGDASNLVDEQALSGEPATSPGGSPATTWTTPFNNDVPYPIHAYIDLGEPYIVTKLFLRDVGGQAPMTVWYGYSGHWTELFTDNLSGFFSWNQHNVFVNTRYLRISKSDPSANVNELIAYGYPVDLTNIDTTPPAAITDLTATADGANAVDVTWTSVGDDENTGNSKVYNLRYSPKPITPKNFYEAKEWEAMPAPAIAGTQQTAHIEGLWAATTYYFAIQSLDENHNISDLSNIVTAKTDEIIGGNIRRIGLSPDMILNESALGDARFLVDEQVEAGEPIEEETGSPQLFWTAGVNPWFYPVYAYIDLGAEHELSQIFLYDDYAETTTGSISIEVGTPFNWTPLLTDDLEGENVWSEHDLTTGTPVTTRYIRVKLHNSQTRMSEIVLYGTATEAIEVDETVETPHAFAAMDDLMGLNAFINDPLGRMQATSTVREYHQWRWDEGNLDNTYPGYPANENAFNPSYVSNWNFDRFYENIQNMGLLNTPSVTGSAHWLNPPFNEILTRPHDVGDDSEDPFSYIEHADHMYQYVARYGNNAVNDGLLKLKADQPVVSGLGTIQYFEHWNEPDAFWKDENVYFTPYDYAAMSSADYDGHQSAMGTTVGVKNADPSAKMPMAGITSLNLDYVKAIKLWADEYRGGSVPFDVINLHHYCNDAGKQHANSTTGVSPEEDRLKERLEEFVTYRNKYMPGKEIWLSEFGYDTNPTSAQRAPQIAGYSNEEVQGQWLVRSYLAIAAAGIDKAQMFMLRDVNAADNTIFQSSGLTQSPANQWAAKPSWYYVYTMKNRLTGMTFDSEVTSGNPNVLIYKFTHPDGDAAYVVWSPTADGTIVEDYDLSLAGGENQAVLVEMAEGDRDGTETALTINSGNVSVDVSERPVFVLVNDGVGAIPKRYTLEEQIALTPSMVTIETGVGQSERLVDEQALVGNPDLGSTTAPTTIWISNGSVSSAYIDLGAEYDLTKIYLYDSVNTGDCTISIGEPGNWTPLFVDDLRYNGIWNAHVVNVTSRYVRVTMDTATSFIGEVAIYAK
ncbi:MAG: fibronectin type III domain-containing protein [Chitinophagales bacterium]